MGLLFRPRRPVARLAAGAATAGIAYNAGKRRSQQDMYNQEAAAAYQASQASPPAPPRQAVPQQGGPVDDTLMAELARLADMHAAGQLTDAEYSAAKAKLLNM